MFSWGISVLLQSCHLCRVLLGLRVLQIKYCAFKTLDIVLNVLRYQTVVGEALGDIVMPLAVF